METILEFIFGFIYQLLNCKSTRSTQHFLGGSRRFGYNTKNSDYDIFVIDSHPGLMAVLDLGFKEVHVSDSNYNFALHYRMMVGSSHIDLVVVHSRNFGELFRQHEMIECITNSNKQLVEFIKVLKRAENIPGSKIYKALLSRCISSSN